jgi:hypothetical protein
MGAFSLRRRHRSLPNVFVQLWRRWIATPADQLLETARLGSDKLEYLTHDLRVSSSGLCTIAGGHADDLLRRRMLALGLDPYEMAPSRQESFPLRRRLNQYAINTRRHTLLLANSPAPAHPRRRQ